MNSFDRVSIVGVGLLGGSLAKVIGRPVASRRSVSNPLVRDPPPATTTPLSTMSAANSGGVRSRAIFTASTMVLNVSAKASRISSSKAQLPVAISPGALSL